MTREEAAQLLWRVAYDKYGMDDNPMRQREAADIVVTALRGSQPDPDTDRVDVAPGPDSIRPEKWAENDIIGDGCDPLTKEVQT